MNPPSEPERWLRGPLPEVPPFLQPVAHALLQARDDLSRVAPTLSTEELWTTPNGAASAGFHLKHLAGSLDRLLTYARGEALATDQLAYLRQEKEPGDPPLDGASLQAYAAEAIDRALEQLRGTDADSLLDERRVGRAGLPSTVIGLLFHAAEHTTRHCGQLITTAKVVRGGGD